MKRQKDEEGGQEWLNTYADMITLVLTFFVLLYSISNVNLTKLEEVASAMQRQLGIEAKTEIEDVPSDLKYPVVGEGAQAPKDAEAPLQQTQQQYQASAREMADMARDIQTYFDSENLDAVVSNSENAVYIRFKNDLLFAPDNANLTDASKSMLDAVGIMLKEKQDNILAIYINGHTALEEQVGIPPKKLICRGYGKYYPIADNTTREGREQNRRVDMIILGTGYKPPDTVQGMETMDPLFPVTMPGDETMMQEGTASD